MVGELVVEAEEGGALAAFSGRNSETEREGRDGG
jgi:hypothetical protein